MGAFLDKPKTEKYNESKVGGGLKYGLSSMQGWRIEMEDAHSAIIGIPDQKETVCWFAVFDGHAGSRVSAHCAHHLLDCIRTNDEFTTSLQQEHSLTKEELQAGVEGGILRGFLDLDEKLRKIPEVASGEDKSGTTAVCSLITDKYLIIANCGDSRAVFCTGSKPALASQDHKPSNELERERIQNAGGSVLIQGTTSRVNGSLAVSRALGDFEYKNVDGRSPTEQLVSPEPEFYIKERIDEQDEFLVLACDGVWDVMTNEEICDFILGRLKVTDNLETICNEVIDTCLYKGSRDNMSIIIITFPAAPKVDPAAVKAEKELNDLLEKKVTDLVGLDSDIELSAVHQYLQDQDIQGLPVGGGLASKKVFIEEVYKKLLPEKYENSQEECPNPLASLLFHNAKGAAVEDN